MSINCASIRAKLNRNKNTHHKKRLLLSSWEFNSKNTQELLEINSRQFLWSAQNLVQKVSNFDENLAGIKANIDDKLSVLEIFQLFLSENVLKHIVRETNNYFTTKTSSLAAQRAIRFSVLTCSGLTC